MRRAGPKARPVALGPGTGTRLVPAPLVPVVPVVVAIVPTPTAVPVIVLATIPVVVVVTIVVAAVVVPAVLVPVVTAVLVVLVAPVVVTIAVVAIVAVLVPVVAVLVVLVALLLLRDEAEVDGQVGPGGNDHRVRRVRQRVAVGVDVVGRGVPHGQDVVVEDAAVGEVRRLDPDLVRRSTDDREAVVARLPGRRMVRGRGRGHDVAGRVEQLEAHAVQAVHPSSRPASRPCPCPSRRSRRARTGAGTGR